jgi:hypothetical protein
MQSKELKKINGNEGRIKRKIKTKRQGEAQSIGNANQTKTKGPKTGETESPTTKITWQC